MVNMLNINFEIDFLVCSVCFINELPISINSVDIYSGVAKDLLRGGAKLEIMSRDTHGGLQSRVQQLLDD